MYQYSIQCCSLPLWLGKNWDDCARPIKGTLPACYHQFLAYHIGEVYSTISVIDVSDIVSIFFHFFDVKFTNDIDNLDIFIFDIICWHIDGGAHFAEETLDTIILSDKFDMHIQRLCADDIFKYIAGNFLAKLKLLHSPNGGVE